MKRATKRAIAYLRRSTDRQETSLLQQLDWAVAEAKHRNLDEIAGAAAARTAILRGIRGESQFEDVYLDDAISGSDLERAGFNAMLRRVKDDPDVAFMLVWDRSRFGRFERSELGSMFEKDVREAGVTMILHNNTLAPRRISDGSLGEDILALIEHQAAGKMRIDLAENVLRGQARTVKEGYWPGGTTPFGFIRVLVNKATKSYQPVVRGTKSSGADGCAIAVIPGHDEDSRRKLRAVKFIAETYYQGHLGLHRNRPMTPR